MYEFDPMLLGVGYDLGWEVGDIAQHSLQARSKRETNAASTALAIPETSSTPRTVVAEHGAAAARHVCPHSFDGRTLSFEVTHDAQIAIDEPRSGAGVQTRIGLWPLDHGADLHDDGLFDAPGSLELQWVHQDESYCMPRWG